MAWQGEEITRLRDIAMESQESTLIKPGREYPSKVSAPGAETKQSKEVARGIAELKKFYDILIVTM